MLTSRHDSALRIINELIMGSDKGIVWALTGSTAFIIQGMQFAPNDIDIQTNEVGAYAINKILMAYQVKPVVFSSTDYIRSHIGYYSIDRISIEVMGDIQKKQGETWEDIIDLRAIIEHVDYKDMTLPVLKLSYESAAYRKLGRLERANCIDSFLLTNRRK